MNTIWHIALDRANRLVPKPSLRKPADILSRPDPDDILANHDTPEKAFAARSALDELHQMTGGYQYGVRILVTDQGKLRLSRKTIEGKKLAEWERKHARALDPDSMAQKQDAGITWHIALDRGPVRNVPEKSELDFITGFVGYISLEEALAGKQAIERFDDRTEGYMPRTLIMAAENGMLRMPNETEQQVINHWRDN